MDKEIEKYIGGYKGPIVVYKLKQLATKDTKNAQLYLVLAAQFSKNAGYVGLYDDIYNLQKKIPSLAEVKLPAYDSSKGADVAIY